jgi:hypothetical protein
VCVVGRRQELLAEVKAECWTLRDPNVNKADITPVTHIAPGDPIVAVQADFAVPKDILHVRNILQIGV